MSQFSDRENVSLTSALIEVLPPLVRRINADVPFANEEETAADDGLRAVDDLRATPGQLSLLRVLIEHGCCMMQELAEHLGVAPSTVTAMVKRLLSQGYVERSRDTTDWRTVRIKITERGQQVYSVFDTARRKALERRLTHLSQQEHNKLVEALPVLRHLLEVII
jgi:DNA-binding MarR family transcriptional regulator